MGIGNGWGNRREGNEARCVLVQAQAPVYLQGAGADHRCLLVIVMWATADMERGMAGLAYSTQPPISQCLPGTTHNDSAALHTTRSTGWPTSPTSCQSTPSESSPTSCPSSHRWVCFGLRADCTGTVVVSPCSPYCHGGRV
jgi:hypothetical protein